MALIALSATGATSAAADRRVMGPAAPQSADQVADAATLAWRAGERRRLRILASRDDPDPWLVADTLCFRGQIDAAESFAAAAPRGDVERLGD